MTRFYNSCTQLLRTFSESIIKLPLTALLGACAVLLYSCEGDPTSIGRKLLPSGDFVQIGSTDSIAVRSYTMYIDSVQTDNPSVSYLGSMFDSYFGRTTAEFVSQIRLGSAWPDKYVAIDSIKLFLHLLTVKGAVNQGHNLIMSEIADEIYKDSSYYSNTPVHLTGYKWICHFPDTLKADTVNDIQVNVPVSFGERVLRDTSMLFHTNSGPDFRSYFKGLYFQMESHEDPLLVSLSVSPPSSPVNYFIFYMHDAVAQSYSFSFVLDAVSQNASFNRYIHDFSAGEPLKKINHINDTTFLDTLIYAQNMNGIYTRLTIPGLKKLKSTSALKGATINKARLVFPIYYDGEAYKSSKVPSQLYIRYTTSTGSKNVIPDYIISPTFFDGQPDTIKNVYNANIATYVQAYLDDTKNLLKPEMEIFLPTNASNNLILKGNKSKTPVKFDLTWTRF